MRAAQLLRGWFALLLCATLIGVAAPLWPCAAAAEPPVAGRPIRLLHQSMEPDEDLDESADEGDSADDDSSDAPKDAEAQPDEASDDDESSARDEDSSDRDSASEDRRESKPKKDSSAKPRRTPRAADEDSQKNEAEDDKPAPGKTSPKPDWVKTKSRSKNAASAKAVDEPAALIAQVETYVPSIERLAAAARRSPTARWYEAVAGLITPKPDETGEGLDYSALFEMLKQIASWPDTSLCYWVYTQDGEGRPRWAARVDWPLADLKQRVEKLLEPPAARKVLGDVKLTKRADGSYVLSLPDVTLAVLSETKGGALVRSAGDLEPPAAALKTAAAGRNPITGADGETNGALLQSRYALVSREDGGGGMFSMLVGVRDIRYELLQDDDGAWRERWNLGWNPLLGAGIKSALGKVKQARFSAPKEAFVTAAFNAGRSMADTFSDLPDGTIGDRADSETLLTVVPGSGFLPVPDFFCQMKVRGIERAQKAIRAAVEKDTQERRDDDRRPAWFEQEIGGRAVFWKDPTADDGMSMALASYRTVLFFEPEGEDGRNGRLIVAETSNWAEDAVRRWREVTRGKDKRFDIPSVKTANWQAVIHWREIYEIAQPWLVLAAGLSEGTALPPRLEEIAAALGDSVVDIKIEFAGLKAQHCGPIPLGAAYVPAITASALGDGGGWNTEAARERTACRHLRVLFHHAKLFKKDFGRWPATVAELDGYVDFKSHPELLYLRPRDEGVLAGVTRMLTGGKQAQERRAAEEREEEVGLDDTLYQIRWSDNDARWRLQFRSDQFKNLRTIYINGAGEIVRVPKEEGDEGTEERRDKGKKL